MPTRDEAIKIVHEAGLPTTAGKIALWWNKQGGKGGWDSYVIHNFSHRVVELIWPEGNPNARRT